MEASAEQQQMMLDKMSVVLLERASADDLDMVVDIIRNYGSKLPNEIKAEAAVKAVCGYSMNVLNYLINHEMLSKDSNLDCDDEHPNMMLMLIHLMHLHGSDLRFGKKQETLLHAASRRGNCKVVSMILDQVGKVKVNCEDEDGSFPLHVAAGSTVKEEEVLKVMDLLVRSGAHLEREDNFGKTALYVAAEVGNERCFKMLIEAGANANRKFGNESILHAAARGGSYEIVSMILDQIDKSQVHYEDSDGSTALHVAAGCASDQEEKILKLMGLLLRNGAHLEKPDNLGKTPLCVAAVMGHKRRCKMLLQAGANGRLKFGDKNESILHVAAKNGDWQLVKIILEEIKGFDISSKDSNESTALHKAASNPAPDKDINDVIKLLLKHRAPIEVKDHMGETPLYLAASAGHDTRCSILLQEGADVKTKNNHGYTPLSIAIFLNRPAVVKVTLAHGADPNDTYDGGSMLHFACGGSEHTTVNPLIVDALLCKGALPDVLAANGEAAIHLAVRRGSAEAVGILLRHGASPHMRNDGGRTPMELALSLHMDEASPIVRLLRSLFRCDGG